MRNAQGLPDYFVVVVEDITQLKLAEQALRQSEERYRRVVEAQTDLICRFDPEFNLTFINQPLSILFGKAPEEMIGSIFWPQFRPSIMRFSWRILPRLMRPGKFLPMKTLC